MKQEFHFDNLHQAVQAGWCYVGRKTVRGLLGPRRVITLKHAIIGEYNFYFTR